MSVGIEKIAGVESAKVELNTGTAKILLRSGNQVRYDQILEVVRNNAFTPEEAKVEALGEVVVSGAALQLKLRGTNQIYALVADPHARDLMDEIKKFAGKVILIEGAIPPPKDKKVPTVIRVKSFKPAPQA